MIRMKRSVNDAREGKEEKEKPGGTRNDAGFAARMKQKMAKRKKKRLLKK